MVNDVALGRQHAVPSASIGTVVASVAGRPLFVAELAAAAGLAIAVFDSPLSNLGKAAVVVALAAALSAAAYLQGIGCAIGKWSLAAVIGFLSFSVAGGYGVARLVEGSVVVGLIALVAAAIGLMLVIGVGVAAVRAAHGIWRLLMLVAEIALVAVLLQLGFMPLAAATVGVHPPRMLITVATPATATAVEIQTPDGALLDAWYTPSANGATVILLPGSMGNRGDTAAHAQVLTEHGYGVLAVDARGSGTSSDFGNMWGWTGTHDIAGAVAWLYDNDVPYGRIGLVGLSMGGEQAITATSDGDTYAHLEAVVAEGVQARVPADLWHVSDDLRGSIERAVSTTMWTIADLWAPGGQPVGLRQAAEANLQTPVLIIAADSPDERSVAGDLADRSSLVEVWQTSGIGHTQALAMAPDEWEARVISFLDRELLGR